MKTLAWVTRMLPIALVLASCAAPLPWPESPLYSFPAIDPTYVAPSDRQQAMTEIEGTYAHFDVVSYEDETEQTTLRTFVVSYGITEFIVQDGKLYEIDTFCGAEQKLSQRNVTATFGDRATQAIAPVAQEVELELRDGQWHVYRPASPTLLGIEGDPNRPLSQDPNDPNLTDPDGDGNPGVTVVLHIGGVIDAELYITRREIYEYFLSLHSNGNLYGRVRDSSEQFVVDATMRILRQQSSPEQIDDPGMNPIMLFRVYDDVRTCADIGTLAGALFPPSPDFDQER